jgi:hypothetical protein
MEENKIQTMQAGKRFFKLINGEMVYGETETVPTQNGTEIIIKKPYMVQNGNVMPYCMDVLPSAPGAIQIHPMNILWTVPLDEFPDVDKAYTKATTGLDVPDTPKIIF